MIGKPVAPIGPRDPSAIGPFEIVGRIGAGGMGMVYLGRDRDGRGVAVKVIRSELTQDSMMRQRFLREVEAARRVRSPVTAAVIDAGPEDEPPWVAFEYVDSPSLEEVVEEQLPRLSAAVGILSGIAEALMAIHQVGLIHRDLKPSNILCPPNGVKVIDFGIAAVWESAHLTTTGLVGTPGWLSPEQILGLRLTPAVDVFAWGCVAVYTLTGRQPFLNPNGDDAPAAIFYRIVNASPDLSGIPPQLLMAVSTALAKDPLARPTVPALFELLLPGQSSRIEATAGGEISSAETRESGTAVGAETRESAESSGAEPTAGTAARATAGPAAIRPTAVRPAAGPTAGPAAVTRRRWPLAGVVLGAALTAAVVGSVALLTRSNAAHSTTGTTTVTTPVPGATTARTTTTTVTSPPAPTTSTTAPGTAPSQPVSLPGFTKSGAPVLTSVRTFQGDSGSLVTDFPWTMNGCSQRTFTVRWRAEGAGPITAGMTGVEMPPVHLSDLVQPTTALAGIMQGDGCSQPAFFFTTSGPDTLEDVAVEYQIWNASP